MAFESVRKLEKLDRALDKKIIESIAERVEYPELDEFKGVYPLAMIEADKEEVARLEGQFQKETRGYSPEDRLAAEQSQKLATAIEVMAAEFVESHNWFGDKTHLIKTTRFDDLKNGADAVLEFDFEEEGIKHQALSIDTTTALRGTVVSRKLERNIEKLLSTEPVGIKYFRSEVSDYIGPLEETVPVVIGLENGNAIELLELFAQLEKLRNQERTDLVREKIKELNQKLEEHPAQIVFLEEIKIQLEFYQSFLAGRSGDIFSRRRENIGEILRIVNGLLTEKDAIMKKAKSYSDGFLEETKKQISSTRVTT